MAEPFVEKEIKFSEINGGNKIESGGNITPNFINSPIEGTVYAQNKSKEAVATANGAAERVEELAVQIGEKQGTTVKVANIAQANVNFTSDPQEQIGSLIYDKNSSSHEMNWGYPNGIPKLSNFAKDLAKWNMLKLRIEYNNEFSDTVVITKGRKSQSNYFYYWEDRVLIVNDIIYTNTNFKIGNFVSEKISSGVVTNESILVAYVTKIWGVNQ